MIKKILIFILLIFAAVVTICSATYFMIIEYKEISFLIIIISVSIFFLIIFLVRIQTKILKKNKYNAYIIFIFLVSFIFPILYIVFIIIYNNFGDKALIPPELITSATVLCISILFTIFYIFMSVRKLDTNNKRSCILGILKVIGTVYPIYILMHYGVDSHRIIVFLSCIISSIIIFFILNVEKKDKDKSFMIFVILLLAFLPVIPLVLYEMFQFKVIYFDSIQQKEQWIEIYVGLLQYYGPAVLGGFIFWHTIKSNKRNRRKIMPLICIKQITFYKNNYEFEIGNVGEDALKLIIIIKNQDKELVRKELDYLPNTIQKETWLEKVKVKVKAKEKLTFYFEYESILHDKAKKWIQYNMTEMNGRLIIANDDYDGLC